MPINIDFGALQQANPFAAYAQGQEIGARQRQRQASASAGQKLATGDRQGAMADLGSAGLVDDVRQLQGDEQAQQDRDRRAQLERGKTLLTVASGLERVPEGQRKAALAGAYPLFQAAGIDTSHFEGLTEDQLSTPNLRAFAGNVESHLQGVNLGGGGYGTFNTDTGEFKTVREPTMRPVIVGNGATALDPETQQPIYSSPKTFAPPRAAGGGGGARPPAAVQTAQTLAAIEAELRRRRKLK